MFSDIDRRMMRLALTEAEKARSKGEIPVGCVVAKGDAVLAAAHNRRISDTDPTAHAEILAIRAAARALGGWRLTGCTVYVTLEPCPMCAGAIAMARAERLVYGADDPAAGCAGSLYRLPEDPKLPSFCLTESGLYADECRAVLSRFFREKRGE